VFFYNEYTPNVIGCLWRPDAFKGQAFSAMYSEYKRPIDNQWVENSLVITNASDVMRAIQFIVRDVVVDVRVLDDRSIKSEEGNDENHNSKRMRPLDGDSEEGSSDDDE
jgi:hypothetical protein